MCENLTRQALPSKKYRELLGTAICVFNSNNAFIIENILSNDNNASYSWYDLIDRTSGRLNEPILNTITQKHGSVIANLFNNIVEIRNRIIHGFQVSVKNDEQILATKDKKHKQYIISIDYLIEFIKKNEELSTFLHTARGF